MYITYLKIFKHFVIFKHNSNEGRQANVCMHMTQTFPERSVWSQYLNLRNFVDLYASDLQSFGHVCNAQSNFGHVWACKQAGTHMSRQATFCMHMLCTKVCLPHSRVFRHELHTIVTKNLNRLQAINHVISLAMHTFENKANAVHLLTEFVEKSLKTRVFRHELHTIMTKK